MNEDSSKSRDPRLERRHRAASYREAYHHAAQVLTEIETIAPLTDHKNKPQRDWKEEPEDLSAFEVAITQAQEAVASDLKSQRNPRKDILQAQETLTIILGDLDSADKYCFLTVMSEAQMEKYKKSEHLSDLKAAIKYAQTVLARDENHPAAKAQEVPPAAAIVQPQEVIAAVLEEPEANGDKPQVILALALATQSRFDEVIQQIQQAVLATPKDHPDHVRRLVAVGGCFNARYRHLGGLSDLEAAIEYTEAALKVTPEGDPDHAKRLGSLGRCLDARFQRLGEVSDLERAIGYLEAALLATPVDHPKRLSRLNTLSNCLKERFDRLGAMSDLETAIENVKAALETAPATHPSRIVSLHNLGNYFSARYKRLGDLHDLGAAMENAEAALAAAPKDHPNRATILRNLGNYHKSRFERLGNLGDLEVAIEYTEEALEATPADHPGRILGLVNLGSCFSTRYRRLGDMFDLARAIENTQEALKAASTGHPDRATILRNLGNDLTARYECFGDKEDLRTATEYAEAALATAPADHPDINRNFQSLGSHFHARYQRWGELRDLETALQHDRAALEVTPIDHPSRVGILSNLGNHLRTRYERLGDLSDLEAAISHTETALAATPVEHPHRASRLHNLGNFYHTRYRRLGTLSDLQVAIRNGQAALAATPIDHPDRAGILHNMTNHFIAHYKRLGTLYDLDAAFKYANAALEATPEYHIEHATRIDNLCICLHNRYLQLGDQKDLDAAIEHAEAALTEFPDDHPSRVGILRNLQNYLNDRFERAGDLNDLESAIIDGRQALVGLPRDHPETATTLVGLGHSLLLSYLETKKEKDFEKSFACFLGAWNCQLAPPLKRVQAAWIAATGQFRSCQTWEESSSLLEDAVRMMPKISLRTLDREDQQNLLSKLSGLSSDAASFALQAGKTASHALRLLELGRGVIIGFAIDSRSELSELKATNPALFDLFTQLREEINSPLENIKPLGLESLAAPDRFSDDNKKSALVRRKKAMEELELSLSEIRKIPAYKDFLLPPAPETLMKLAKHGSIVVINSTFLRSDAIIVTTSSIKALELPKLVYTEAKERMRQMNQELVKGTFRTYGSRNAKMCKLLIWLWDVAVGPVLDELQLNGTLARVWWIGTGELGRAPFHAAGDHSPHSTRNTLSRVVSSYIPTIKALSYTRGKELNLPRKKDSRLLMVTMPTTPGGAALPYVGEEVDAIVRAIKGRIRTVAMIQPSAAEVLQQLPLCDVVHFACHGVSDSSNPSDSSLVLLSNGTADPLKVRDILETNTENAQLAYLSACSTADNSAIQLADETIHLASAFQLAGFNHVVATLWKSKDDVCMEVARDFYGLLFDAKGSSEGHEKFSMALHEAIKSVRDKRPDKPCNWAPFIHMGA